MKYYVESREVLYTRYYVEIREMIYRKFYVEITEVVVSQASLCRIQSYN